MPRWSRWLFVPTRGDDPPEPPAAPRAARNRAAVKTVPTRGDDPPEPPAAPRAARNRAAVKDHETSTEYGGEGVA